MTDAPDSAKQDIQERFLKLPKVVQNAIQSADVEKHLRDLAETHKLHLDQWVVLENEVMLTLLGFEPTDQLAQNIEREVGISSDAATALAGDVSKLVFEPIREELERELENPNTEAKTEGAIETARREVLSSETVAGAPATPLPEATVPAAPLVTPATPPAPPVTGKAERAQIAPTYVPSVPSTERKAIQGDPYREQIDLS